MKRPLLDEHDRFVINNLDCYHRNNLLLFLAVKKLQRSLDSHPMVKFFKWIVDKLSVFCNFVSFRLFNKDI